VNVSFPLLQFLAADEARAGRLLAAFEEDHPGVTVVAPAYSDQRWQAAIDAGAVPGDDPGTIRHLTADQPSGLLAKLEELFAGVGARERPG
jgi:hypothetical protein